MTVKTFKKLNSFSGKYIKSRRTFKILRLLLEFGKRGWRYFIKTALYYVIKFVNLRAFKHLTPLKLLWKLDSKKLSTSYFTALLSYQSAASKWSFAFSFALFNGKNLLYTNKRTWSHNWNYCRGLSRTLNH